MKSSFTLPVIALALLSVPAVSVSAAPKHQLRDYRPLAAKAVRLTVSNSEPRNSSASAKFIREGWTFFDLGQWSEAADRFLSGFEADPTQSSAGEGLAMALYHSGNYSEAAAVAHELAGVMPQVKGMIAGALYEEVRDLVDREQFTDALVLVSLFPASDVTYRPARELAGSAAAVETAMRSAHAAGGTVAAVLED